MTKSLALNRTKEIHASNSSVEKGERLKMSALKLKSQKQSQMNNIDHFLARTEIIVFQNGVIISDKYSDDSKQSQTPL